MSAPKKTILPKAKDSALDLSEQVLWARPGYLVRRLNQIHYAMFFEECKNESITPVQYGILTALSVNPGIDQTTIGKELGLDRTTTADVVKRLEGKGYLERQTNPEDRRARKGFITTEGLRVMNELHAGMARAQDRLLKPLPVADRRIFIKLLSILVKANNQYSRAAVRGI